MYEIAQFKNEQFKNVYPEMNKMARQLHDFESYTGYAVF